jgi:hypothetical protein
LKKGIRTWILFAGAFVIVITCLVAYFGSKPAEANISMLSKPPYTLMAGLTVIIR